VAQFFEERQRGAGHARGAVVERLAAADSACSRPSVARGNEKSSNGRTGVQKKLQDRVAIVYGAGSVGDGWGNGKASAVAYARAGARVACVDMNAAAAQATVDIIKSEGGEAIALEANVTSLDEVRAATDATIKAFGRLDVLHNNVGITAAGGPVEASEESWDRVMNVNVKSMFFTCKCALPTMVAQGRGAIVNISSLAGIRWTGYNYSSYYASKAAVINFTRGVAIEYAARGIRANSILPGLRPVGIQGFSSVLGCDSHHGWTALC
jgi:NAD(P)-dependent dehydrogenase (short-subunit alcohol dehydrogenase family)